MCGAPLPFGSLSSLHFWATTPSLFSPMKDGGCSQCLSVCHLAPVFPDQCPHSGPLISLLYEGETCELVKCWANSHHVVWNNSKLKAITLGPPMWSWAGCALPKGTCGEGEWWVGSGERPCYLHQARSPQPRGTSLWTPKCQVTSREVIITVLNQHPCYFYS